MGYRSDVVIAITKEVKAKVILLDNKLPELLRNYAEEHIEETTGVIYYEMCGVKWYESYPDVIQVVEFLDTLSQEDYHFLRAGEEAPDSETRGNLEAEIYLENYISKPY